MPTTIINDFSLEPKAEPPAPASAGANSKSDGGGGKASPDSAREIERVLRTKRNRDMRLWVY
jgi:hypothetical protein